MNIKEIKELIEIIDKTSISELKIEEKDVKIKISKEKKTEVVYETVSVPTAIKEETKVETKNSSNENIITEKIDTISNENDKIIKSPIVGTYYSAASPENPSFVKIGDKVKSGQTLCIVEAMKIMNEIKSDIDGEVIDILVENEDIVEFNQPLIIIRG